MTTLNLVNGSVVEVVQPVVASVEIVAPAPRQLQVVAVPSGSSGGSADAYEFIQGAAASTWTIALPLSFPNRRPGVDIYVNDVLVETDVTWYPGTKTIVITFPSPTSGVAVIT